MSMSREEVINNMFKVGRDRWGDEAIVLPSGWFWVGKGDSKMLDCKYREPIRFTDVFPETVTTQSLETELSKLINLPPTVHPEAYIDHRHRLLQAAIDKIKQFDKPARDERLDNVTFEQFETLSHGLTALIGGESPLPEQPEVIIQQVKDLKNRNSEEFEALEKALSFALPPTTDRNHSILTCATQEITETRAMYEKAAAEHKDLRVRFGEMMGVSGPSNDEMVEFAYQANSKPVDLPPVPCTNKYHRSLKGETVDVYDVLKAFEVKCPALQHLIKKALCVGIRGHKDESTDLNDILESAKRAVELGSK